MSVSVRLYFKAVYQYFSIVVPQRLQRNSLSKKIEGYYTKLLRAVFIKFRNDQTMKQILHGHMSLISRSINLSIYLSIYHCSVKVSGIMDKLGIYIGFSCNISFIIKKIYYHIMNDT